MLMDVLGIAIAFVTIMLLLSIVVTAAVQASQAILRLRGRNLLIGVAAAILQARKGTADKLDAKARKKAKRDALKVLSSRSLDPLNGDGVAVGGKRAWARYWLVGPRVSHIDAKDLDTALQDAGFDAGVTGQIKTNFQRLEPHSSKRFEKVARGWSFAWALLVAFVMQVSTPALLNKLTTNAKYRESIVAGADRELAYAGEALKRLDYETAAASALVDLAGRHEDLRPKIEQASGVGTSKRYIVEELRLALGGVPAQDKILQEYEKLLEETAVRDAESVARDTLDRLAAYDIRLWPARWEFYYKQARRDGGGTEEPLRAGLAGGDGFQWNNLAGVLVTAILLSLGAPFWFNRLSEVVGLRDRLSKKPDAEPQDSGKDETSGTPESKV